MKDVIVMYAYNCYNGTGGNMISVGHIKTTEDKCEEIVRFLKNNIQNVKVSVI